VAFCFGPLLGATETKGLVFVPEGGCMDTQAITSKIPGKEKRTSSLADCEKQMLAYALSAGALTFVPRADAQIIYTPADVTIEGCGTVYQLDLNNDGLAEARLTIAYSSGLSLFYSYMWVLGNPNKRVGIAADKANLQAFALNKGTSIGPDTPKAYAKRRLLIEDVLCWNFTSCPTYRKEGVVPVVLDGLGRRLNTQDCSQSAEQALDDSKKAGELR
jgi:hypothetical protein